MLDLILNLRRRWNTLRQERQTRWATEAHHCVACGVAFGPDLKCQC